MCIFSAGDKKWLHPLQPSWMEENMQKHPLKIKSMTTSISRLFKD